MKYLTAVGITVGLLAGAWVQGSGMIGLTGFVGFLGWATYFAVGQGLDGVPKAVCCNLSGVFWGAVTIFLSGLIPGQAALIVLVIVAAAIMCWQANIPILSFIPGTFIGNACYYGNGNEWLKTGIALLCGIALGVVSDYAAKWLSKVTSKQET